MTKANKQPSFEALAREVSADLSIGARGDVMHLIRVGRLEIRGLKRQAASHLQIIARQSAEIDALTPAKRTEADANYICRLENESTRLRRELDLLRAKPVTPPKALTEIPKGFGINPHVDRNTMQRMCNDNYRLQHAVDSLRRRYVKERARRKRENAARHTSPKVLGSNEAIRVGFAHGWVRLATLTTALEAPAKRVWDCLQRYAFENGWALPPQTTQAASSGADGAQVAPSAADASEGAQNDPAPAVVAWATDRISGETRLFDRLHRAIGYLELDALRNMCSDVMGPTVRIGQPSIPTGIFGRVVSWSSRALEHESDAIMLTIREGERYTGGAVHRIRMDRGFAESFARQVLKHADLADIEARVFANMTTIPGDAVAPTGRTGTTEPQHVSAPQGRSDELKAIAQSLLSGYGYRFKDFQPFVDPSDVAPPYADGGIVTPKPYTVGERGPISFPMASKVEWATKPTNEEGDKGSKVSMPHISDAAWRAILSNRSSERRRMMRRERWEMLARRDGIVMRTLEEWNVSLVHELYAKVFRDRAAKWEERYRAAHDRREAFRSMLRDTAAKIGANTQALINVLSVSFAGEKVGPTRLAKMQKVVRERIAEMADLREEVIKSTLRD